MRLAAGIVLLLLVAGTALPAQSQEGSEEEPVRWPHFETEALIAPPDTTVRAFGHAVATDGDRVLVAAQHAAYVYARDQDHWALEATLDAGFDDVRSVSLFDGHALVSTHGTVAHWRLLDGSWKRQADLAGDGLFGDDVLVRGNVLFVSQPQDNALAGVGSRGAVHVYHHGTTGYTHRQTLQEPTAPVQRVFGADLAMRGHTLVVGAPAQPLVEQAAPGAAYVYTRNGGTWSLTHSIEANRGNDAESSFGHKVATTGSAVVVSASPSYLATGGDASGSGWVAFYERNKQGDWINVQEESTDATAVAAREDAVLVVDWWWSMVGVYLHESAQLQCWWGTWCQAGYLGGWDAFYGDNPLPRDLAIEDRVAVLGAPAERYQGQPTGLVLAYYDNALPFAVALPNEPVEDLDQDGHEPFVLDASHSFDRDGTIVSYAWYQDGAKISDAVFVDLDLPLGTYDFALEVTDDLGGIGRAEVPVVVRPPQLGLEIHYCCSWYRGIDPGQSLYFWSDVDDHRAGAKHWDWDWDGDGVTDSTEANPRVPFPHGGTWPVHLQVTNEAGDVLHAYQDIVVNNARPDADAGLPQVVVVDAAGLGTATLDGSGSTDPDGSIRQYNWLRRDPTTLTYSTVASGKTADVQVTHGVNEFQLRVQDDDGATAQATTTVIAINPGQNATGNPPIADFVAKAKGRTLTVEDASEAGDAPIVAWTWGPSLKDLQNGGRKHALTFEDAGPQPVYLTVFDADGRKATALRTVEIMDGPPKLYAWPMAGTVPQGVHGVFLASAEDEAPDRLAWEWRIDGKPYSDHQDAGHTFDELGNHTIHVQVTDDQDHTVSLSGWIDVISEEEFRERFADANETLGAGNGTEVFEGALEAPDAAIQRELDQQRAAEEGGEPDTGSDDDEEDAPAPLAAAAAPKPPAVGGVPVVPLVWAGIALLLAVFAAVEVRRRIRHHRARRQRYEAAMKARLMRHEPAVEFRAGKR